MTELPSARISTRGESSSMFGALTSLTAMSPLSGVPSAAKRRM